MAVRINASGEYLRRTTSLPSSTSFTLCGWMRPTDRTNAYQYFGLESATDWLLLGYQTNPGTFQTASSGSPNYGNFSSNPTADTWIFFALTCGGTGNTDLKGYYAGLGATAFLTAACQGVSFTPTMLTIGNDSYDEYLNCGYANVKVYDAVLTEAELWNEMRSIVPVRLANLHLWSPLWTTADVQDYSGNGRNWTSAGSLSTEDHPPIAYGLPMWVMPTAGAAGTNYEQSAAGSLTPSGVIVRKPAKVLAGSIAPTGALSRQAGKVAEGSIAPSGVLSRMAGKILSGALAPSGALQTAVIKLVSIAGSLGLAGALSRMTGKALSGSITPTGAASRQTRKSFAGSLTPSGALDAAVVRLLSLAGSLGLAGGLVRQTNKAIAGGMSPSGALIRQIGKSLAGVLTPAGALAAEKIAGVIQVSVSGALALSGALSRATSKSFAGVLIPAGGIVKRISKSIAGALSLAGALVRQLLNIPVPASRIYAINGEDRAYVVANEDRAFSVLGEDRTLAIGE